VINRSNAEINKKYGTFLIAELINLFPKEAAPNSKPKYLGHTIYPNTLYNNSTHMAERSSLNLGYQ